MRYYDEAVLARLSGDLEDYNRKVNSALILESNAATMLLDKLDAEPSRSVLFRSAASIAIEIGDRREAERLIACGLTGNPPEEIAEELRDLMEQVFFDRHLALRGEELSSQEFQLSLAGNAVGFGVALSTEVRRRYDSVEKLVYRFAERKSNRAFREKGGPDQDITQGFSLYESVPRAASYAVTFRLGRPASQSDIFLSPEDIIVELFTCFDLLNNGEFDRIRDIIPQNNYYDNFMGLARQILPDGNNIKQVGLTSAKDSEVRKVAITTTRNQITRLKEGINRRAHSRAAQNLPSEVVEFKGFLREASSRKYEVLIEPKGGVAITIFVSPDLMTDVVKQYFDEHVVVSAKREGRQYRLEDIYSTPP